ncbi:MAG TPA: tyrosine decarboxylase MfnA [Candidatus Nanoarchaeia archaeon]|nr:tyrosine decarboxylase MfnA [Candidatus Nanoarchaeia archaeon]
MRAKGLGKSEVLAKLRQAKAKDVCYRKGKIFSSMCTTPNSTAKRARELFVESNLGDPGLFAGSLQLEKEAVSSLLELLHAPATAAGIIVSGGTEANLLAIYAARNAAKLAEPELVVPWSAHFSFDKICDILRVKLVKADLNDKYTVDPKSVEACINKNTIAIVGNVGSAELGAVDNIGALSKIAESHGLPLHVDAAFGGLVLPFLRELGYEVDDFDFSLNGVQSITVDPHKMGQVPVPAGGILFRNSDATSCIRTGTPYLTEPFQCTFVGTRPGASAAAAWAAFESMGREGFKRTVKRCIDLTAFLKDRLEKSNFEIIAKPTMNIVAFRTTNSKLLVDQLRKRGYFVSYVPRLDAVRIVLMPHLTKRHLINFVQVLGELAKA